MTTRPRNSAPVSLSDHRFDNYNPATVKRPRRFRLRRISPACEGQKRIVRLGCALGACALAVLGISGLQIRPRNTGVARQPSARPAFCAFQPTASGQLSAVLSVADDSMPLPQTVAVSGTRTVPIVQLAPPSLQFSSTVVGIVSASQPIQVSNNGTGAPVISGVSFGGADGWYHAHHKPVDRGAIAGAIIGKGGRDHPEMCGARIAAAKS